MWKEIKPTKPVLPDKNVFIQEIDSIWDTGIMTNNGEKVQKFKSKLIEYTGCKNLDLFVNGHTALLLAIKAMELKGEVITSPFTFISTTNAIVQNGLVPVFADIDDSYNLNPNVIEELITEKTCAVITPHIFGIPCDVNKIEKIAKKHKLKVIYDGAQAFGTRVNGKDIACFGDIAMFSFHAIKIFNSIEGGMLSYHDNRLQKKFELYRNFGISYNELGSDVDEIGINAKMNEFQAAMGIVNLSGLNHEIGKRKKIAEQYRELLDDVPGIETYKYRPEIEYNYAYFPIKVLPEYGITRDDLWYGLKEAGIGTRKLYDKLTCDYNCYQNKEYIKKIGNAEKVKNLVLDLPIYGELSEEDMAYLCQRIKGMRK